MTTLATPLGAHSAVPPAPRRRRRAPTALIGLLVTVAVGAAFGWLAGSSPIMGVAAAGGLLLAVAMAVRPDVAVYVVVGVIYSNTAVILVQFHNVPAFAALVVPALLVAPVAYQLLLRRQPVVITSAFPLIVVFLLVQIVGTIFADDVSSAFDDLFTFVVEGVGLYFLLVNSIRTEATLRAVIWVLLAVGTFLGVLSFYQDETRTYDNNYFGFAQTSAAVVGGADSGSEDQLRLAGPIGEKNRYAQIMLMLVPLGLFAAISAPKRWVKAVAIAAAAAAAVGVALTFSRGAAVGFGLVVIVMVALGYIRAIQLALVGLAVALLFVAVPSYGNRVGSLLDLTSILSGDTIDSADGAVLSRATEGLTALLVFADHPLIGVGPGRFPAYYLLYADDVGLRVLNSERQAHDLYLHIAAENGILGLSAFLGILGVTMRDLIRVRRRWLKTRPEMAAMATGLMLAVLTYMTTGLFLHLSYARYFWLIMALAGAAAHIGLRLTEPAAESAEAAEPAASSDRALRPAGAPAPAPI